MFPALPAYAAPTGGQVAAGSGVISQAGGNTTVNQTSQNLSLNWQSFNVGAHESVNFVQPNSAAIAVNRIADASASQILGSLNANGQVFLINPNGIVFGAGAQVNVGGLVASTLNISDSDLTAATRHFTGSGVGTIVNHGTITAAPGGYVVLLGRLVSNQGTISTPGGTAALGAGSAVSLSFDANHLLSMQVDQSTLAALAENKQLIVADGGQVLMSAGAKNSLLASVVNNTGVVQAQTVANHNGRIVLLAGMAAGTTEVGGTLDASSPEGAAGGGFIETSGAVVRVADDARITTHAAHGQTGTWLIDPQDYTIAASGGDITGSTLSTHLGGNNITLMSSAGGTAGSGNINVNDAVSWNANTLTIIAANNININAVMTASGTAGLALNAATTNGADAGVTGGTVNVMPGTGRVDFAGRSGTGFLTINGNGYTVLNSLGVEGDVTGGAATLQGMAASANLAGYYALGSDIDASATNGWNSGAGFDPIGNSTTSFTGVFDGLGHTISGVIINRPALDRVGLFGSTVDPVIRNVGLSSVNITGNDLVGGLVGYKFGGDVSNSYATGQVIGGQYTGGLVGANMGSISNSYAAVTVTGDFGTGGLVGYNLGSINNTYATGQVTGTDWYTGGLLGGNVNSGSVSNSYATGQVIGRGSAAGGLVGASVDTSSISNSYATGNVSSDVNDAGGLVASSNATISNSYATGQVTGNAINVGGLVGVQYSGSISQSYATGAVNGPNAGGSTGGLVGRQDGGTVSSSYWNRETTGQNHSTGSADSFGLSSAEMLNASSFAGWDIATTGGSTAAWRIYEGHTAPLLRAFMTDLAVTANNVATTYTGAAYAGSNAYTFGALTPNFWLQSAGVNTGLFIGNANTSAPAIELGTYALDRGPHSGQLGYDIAFTPGSLTINPVTVPPEVVPTESLPVESLPINVKMTIAGLTQDFSQPDSGEPATDHWGFTLPNETDAVASDLFTVVGSGVRLP
ncbi:two-partner secretion domain-containing protein [Pollutimonas thiosulfatoxidans]|nr:GLUG motif-containing protein [Pollutimonas thiosulfatoxidans]